MFTGIVEEVGTVATVEKHATSGARIGISCATVVADAAVGASIAVNGVCLTVTSFTTSGFTADLNAETLRVTSLGDLDVGHRVNLERPLAADGRFGGHLVQGHVDGVAKVTGVADEPGTRTVRLRVPGALHVYIVPKGSITIDGVSLTVNEVDGDEFEVALIPHTCAVTTLGDIVTDAAVNLEVDVVAKYVARLLAAGASTPYVGDRS